MLPVLTSLLLLAKAISSAIPNKQDVLITETCQNTKRNELRFSDLNFLHTTDTHGWLGGHHNQPTYGADWGEFISFADQLRKIAEANGQDLLLVDSGDRHDGNGLSDASVPNGFYTSPIFARQSYDIVSIGNHELYLWENTQQELDIMVPTLTTSYVCSNVEFLRDGKYYPIGQKYRYFSTRIQKKRILAFSFLFDFKRANERTRVIPIETAVTQDWFKSVLSLFPSREVDLILVVGHLPVDRNWAELQLLHSVLRSHYVDTPIQYFGGHSHIRNFLVLDEKSTGLQSGRFCETVGFLALNTSPNYLDVKERYFRSYIDFNVELFQFHSHIKQREDFDTEKGLSVSKELQDIRKTLGLDSVIGHVTKSNYYMDYVPLTHPQNIYRLLTERVIPTLKPSSNRTRVEEERLVIINTGSIRYDLYKGPYTVDSRYIVSPFQNDWVRITLPKSAAIKIGPILNRESYIAGANSNSYLLPPHFQGLGYGHSDESSNSENEFKNFKNPLFDSSLDENIAGHRGKLTKGYVTHDDFGSDGDDTPHKAVKNHQLTNVVVSNQLKPAIDDDAPVDVVFYNFLTPHVKGAVEKLGYTVEEPELYSRKYLGLLLDEFVATNQL